MSRDTRCPGQSPSWDGVGCPRTPRVVPGHLRCPRTVLSQDGQLSWDGRRRSRTALLGHQVSRDTTCPWTFFSAPERPPLTPDVADVSRVLCARAVYYASHVMSLAGPDM